MSTKTRPSPLNPSSPTALDQLPGAATVSHTGLSVAEKMGLSFVHRFACGAAVLAMAWAILGTGGLGGAAIWVCLGVCVALSADLQRARAEVTSDDTLVSVRVLSIRTRNAETEASVREEQLLRVEALLAEARSEAQGREKIYQNEVNVLRATMVESLAEARAKNGVIANRDREIESLRDRLKSATKIGATLVTDVVHEMPDGPVDLLDVLSTILNAAEDAGSCRRMEKEHGKHADEIREAMVGAAAAALSMAAQIDRQRLEDPQA